MDDTISKYKNLTNFKSGDARIIYSFEYIK